MKKQGSFFRSIYFTIALLVSIGAILPCFFIGFKASEEIKKVLIDQSTQRVDTMTESVKSLSDLGKKLVVEIYQDKDVIPILYGKNQENSKIIAGVNRLHRYLNSSSGIESIYVYNDEEGMVYSTLSQGRSTLSDFEDEDAVNFLSGKEQCKKLSPIPRSVDGTAVYTFVYYESVQEKTGHLKDVIMVNISQNLLQSQLMEKSLNTFENAFVISNQGELLSQYEKLPLYTNLRSNEFIKDILNSKKDSGENVIHRNDGEYFVKYQKMPQIEDWIFVDMVEYSVLTEPVLDFTKYGILTVVVLTVLLNLVAYWISQKVYRPIAKLENRFIQLESEYRKSKFSLKNTALQKFLSSTNPMKRSQMEDMIEQYHVNMLIESKIKMISITIKEAKIWREIIQSGDGQLMWFAIGNICDELANQWNPTIHIVMQDQRLVMLMNMETTYSDKELEEKLLIPLQETIYKFYQMEILIMIGETAEDMSMLPMLYQNVERYEQYFFLINKKIITQSEIMEREQHVIEYPSKKEEIYLSYFQTGNQEEANQVCKEILTEAAQHTYHHFLYVVNRMVYSVWDIIGREKVELETSSVNQKEFSKQIQNAETMEDIFRTFQELNHHMAQYVLKKKDDKKKDSQTEIIQRIDEIILSQYTDINLNINKIADDFGMSSAYIGRIYSKKKGKTITEVITEKRLEEACRLLKTPITIQEVAIQSGFGNSTYFYRIFKKNYGITPSSYREKQ